MDKLAVYNNNCIERHNLRFFFTISSLRHELSTTHMLKWPGHSHMQITCNTLNAYHVQHVMCHVVRRDSTAIKFDRLEIAIIFALFYWLKPLTDEGGEEYSEKTPDDELQKCHILKPENSSPNWDLNTHSSIGDRLGKQMCSPLQHVSPQSSHHA